jgi:hypothetical protein
VAWDQLTKKKNSFLIHLKLMILDCQHKDYWAAQAADDAVMCDAELGRVASSSADLYTS